MQLGSVNDTFALLDRSRTFDDSMVVLLDQVIQAMFEEKSAEKRESAHKILEEFRTQPDTWKHVALILSKSQNANSKFFALQVLQNCIQTRWNILPAEERAGIKQYVTELVIKLCMDDEVCAREKHFLTKINECLIQIVKREWPDHWTNFISEICKASQVSQNICENNMRLLNMLSEELFDFGKDTMLSAKVTKLKERMTSEFRQIYEVALFVLTNAIQNPAALRKSLVKQTLACLAHFLKWIPYGYIFEAYNHNNNSIVLVDLLIDHFWESMDYRIECTKCLTEIASLNFSSAELQTFGHKLAAIWPKICYQLSILPLETMQYENISHRETRLFWETFYTQTSLCITAFLRNFRESIVEKDANNKESLFFVLQRLVLITDINHEETFKICLDYWHLMVTSLLREFREYERNYCIERGFTIREDSKYEYCNQSGLSLSAMPDSLRVCAYKPIMIEVQKVLIKKMAKPQEIYIMYDADACEVTREYNPNTAEIALYTKMRITQMSLTTMLQDDSERLMVEVLDKETDVAQAGTAAGRQAEAWDPTYLNRLCYSVGSITGAMFEPLEKRFLVIIIKALLTICDIKNSTANKAIVASNIMYVVGQYPRFLKTNWRFLNTVLSKLYEFMGETFPGVQQMACETFLKITSNCGKVIAAQNGDSGGPYINELIGLRDEMTTLLDDKLILWFYESVGNVISALDMGLREHYIACLMERCNRDWDAIIMNATNNQQCLMIQDVKIWNEQKDAIIFQVEITRAVIQILRVNNRVCKSTGFAYTNQLLHIYQSMIQLYNLYTLFIHHSIQAMGISCFKHNNINMMHLTKRSILHLLETFITNIPHSMSRTLSNVGTKNLIATAVEEELNNSQYNDVLKQLVDSIISTILVNYKSSIAETRDHEVLCLTATLIEKLGNAANNIIPLIFEQIFDCTLDMVKTDFHSFPDHRENFYELLQKCTRYSFDGVLQLPSERLGAFIMSLIWAFKHEHPAVAEKGLLIMLNFLNNLLIHDKKMDTRQGGTAVPSGSKAILGFCKGYYYMLLKEILGVLTDTLHKSGFRLQTEILKNLIKFIQVGQVNDPSADLTKMAVMRFLVDLIGHSFNTLHEKQIEAFVVDLFNYSIETASEHTHSEVFGNSHGIRFQTHLRDFLLSLKEFSGAGEEFERIFEQDRQNAIERARAIEMGSGKTAQIKEVAIE